MLTCKACGSILVSDGEWWQCPYRRDRNIHDRSVATEIPDMRLNSLREQREQA